MSKKKVVLHIGQSKTATTTFQNFCFKNRVKLAGLGINYLEAGVTISSFPAHYGLLHDHFYYPIRDADTVFGDDHETLDKVWIEAVEEIRNSACPISLISCESAWLLEVESIRYLYSRLKEFDVFIILVLRKPGHYIESSYKQHIKTGAFTESFTKFLDRRRTTLDYVALVDRWRTVFGSEKLGLLSYEQINSDLIGNMIRALGVSTLDISKIANIERRNERSNITPPNLVLVVLRWLTRLERRVPKRANWCVIRFRKSVLRSRRINESHLLRKVPCDIITKKEKEVIGRLSGQVAVECETPEIVAQKILASSTCV